MTYSAEVLADSPLAYWRQDDASGTTMTDAITGGTHNGTYSGTVTLNQTGLLVGDSNPCADFGGGSALVTSGTWMDGSAVTVEAIIRPDTIPGAGGYQFIASRNDGGTIGPWWLAVKGGKVSFLILTGTTGATEFIGTATLSASTTYHIACTYDGANMRIFINGTQDASTAKTGALDTRTTSIKVGNWQSANLPFDGKIDELALYGTALSPSRIAAHYTAATTAGSSASGTASLSLSASGTGAAAAGGSAALSLGASGTGAAPISSSAALSLSASGSLDAPTAASGTASLSLTASGTGVAAGTASASLALSASGSVELGAAGTASLQLSADGTATQLFVTDTSNLLNGRDRRGSATVTITRPVQALPVTLVLAQKVDKALAYPAPVMVNGRPT